MREYEGFGGNILFLDSKKVIARTQYIEEECLMTDIHNSSFTAPNFTKNGCLSITTENNVIPIYFLPKHSSAMAEAFGIIAALAKEKNHDYKLQLGAQGKRLGNAKCIMDGHPILRAKGRMSLYIVQNALRCEYRFVDQGCTVPFNTIEQIVVHPSTGEQRKLLSASNSKVTKIPDTIIKLIKSQTKTGKPSGFFSKQKHEYLTIAFVREGEAQTIAFEGKECVAIGEKLAEAIEG